MKPEVVPKEALPPPEAPAPTPTVVTKPPVPTPKAPTVVALEPVAPPVEPRAVPPTVPEAPVLTPEGRKSIIDKLGGPDVMTRFGRTGSLSDDDLRRLSEEPIGVQPPKVEPTPPTPVSPKAPVSIKTAPRKVPDVRDDIIRQLEEKLESAPTRSSIAEGQEPEVFEIKTKVDGHQTIRVINTKETIQQTIDQVRKFPTKPLGPTRPVGRVGAKSFALKIDRVSEGEIEGKTYWTDGRILELDSKSPVSAPKERFEVSEAATKRVIDTAGKANVISIKQIGTRVGVEPGDTSLTRFKGDGIQNQLTI